MIVSSDSNPSPSEFEALLARSTDLLKKHAITYTDYYLTRGGTLLEEDVHEAMSQSALGGPFENRIHRISGLSFPDIVYRNHDDENIYGVEVKTTKQESWRTTGNSVLESTRIEGVKRIYLLFARLSEPIQFRWNKYEKCLYDVAVTHSPRYLVDMDLRGRETIFDKMGRSYDDIYQMEDPASPIISYYRDLLRNEGRAGDVWWVDDGSDDPPTADLIIKPWSTLSTEEKSDLQKQAMILFPEIFRENDQDKYFRLALWLVDRRGVLNPHVRDDFSAGGTDTQKTSRPFGRKGRPLVVGGNPHRHVSRVFQHLYDLAPGIPNAIEKLETSDLAHYWERPVGLGTGLNQWVELVLENAKGWDLPFELGQMIRERIAE